MKRIVVVGVGALGSHVVLLLRNAGAQIRLIDFDRVEQRNVASQFHGKPGVGKLKVQALQMLMLMLFGASPALTPNPVRLAADNVRELLAGHDLIIDCVDNAATRALIQGFARETGSPCLHGALAADGSFGRVVWDEHFAIDSESGAGAPTCENGEFLPFIALTSAYIAQAATAFLRDGRRGGYQISPGGTIYLILAGQGTLGMARRLRTPTHQSSAFLERLSRAPQRSVGCYASSGTQRKRRAARSSKEGSQTRMGGRSCGLRYSRVAPIATDRSRGWGRLSPLFSKQTPARRTR